MIFDYPEQRSHRRHGPAGYADYESYREWLRDEFCFRCIYCLKRETWGRVTGEFELDHFKPQSVSPEKALDYQNLVYACRTCNSIKNACSIDDPFATLHKGNFRCDPDGRLVTVSTEATRLVATLDLNSPRAIEWRLLWSRIVSMAKLTDNSLFEMLVGFPNDLPDLSRKQPPSNSRPEGLDESWFVKQRRGEISQGADSERNDE